MMRFVESVYQKSAVYPKDYPASAYPEFAFAGKSNVGKSSLLNALAGKRLLAKTSGTPGKTRTLNFFLLRWKNDAAQQEGWIQFTDLPGYGYAAVSLKERDSWRLMVDRYLIERPQLKSIVVIVDIRHPADSKDLALLELLKSRNLDYCVVATKSDKIPRTKLTQTLKRLKEELDLKQVPLFAVSSAKRTGITELMGWLEKQLA